MAKGGKKPSRGGGLRRPPPGDESPQVESRKPPTRRPPPGEADEDDESRRGGGSDGSGGMSRGGQSITTPRIKEEPPDESENMPPTRSSGRGEQSISARNRDDPPDEAPDHQMLNDYNNGHGGRTGDRASSYARERHNGLQPPPSYTPSSRYHDDRHVQKSTNNSRGHQYRDNDTRHYDDGRSVKSTSSGRVNTRKYHDDQRSVKSSSSGRINTRRYNDNMRNAYMENDNDNVNGDYDYPLLDMEQDQYEEYQDQHYNQQYYPQQPSQSQSPHFSTHRQFNLTPIYDVEMASMSSGKKGKKKNRGSRSQKGSRKGKYDKLSQGGRSKGLDDIFAYLNSDSEDENSSVSDSNSAEEEEEEDEPRRHEEFYNYDDDDDESDYESDEYSEYDDDEERPLRSSKSRRTNNNGLRGTKHTVVSILNNSDVCLNRALLLAFAIVCFVFVRDRTPWWKEHEQRVARKEHHHHHIIAGTDDDDEPAIDPMAVYNTNDDDSTHTRDHDPLGKYDKYTKEKDTHPSSKNNDKDDDASSSAGERISNRPGVKSLNHGYDPSGSYSDRPKAEHSMSSALPGNEFDVEQIDAEKTAILESEEMESPSEEMESPSEEMESPSEEGSGEVVAFGADDGGTDGDNDEMRVEQEILPPPPSESDIGDTESGEQVVLPPPVSSTDEMLEPSGSTIGGEQVTSEHQQDLLETMPLPSMGNTPGGDVDGSIAAVDSQPHDDMDTLIEWGEPEDEPSAEEMPFDEEVADAGDVAYPDGQNSSPEVSKQEDVPPPSTPKDPILNEPIFNQAMSMSGEEIKSVYEDSYYKWNHPLEEKDVPVFWRIPRSASSSVESVLSFCYRMTLASDRGAGHEQDKVCRNFLTVLRQNPLLTHHMINMNSFLTKCYS